MELSSSRVFEIKNNKTLSLRAIKSDKNRYYVGIDHPVVLGYEPMTECSRLEASTEYLDAVNKNFWEEALESSEDLIHMAVGLSDNFIKMPASDWVNLIKLYSYFCEKGSGLEVCGLLICRNSDKQVRVVIPEQVVTKVSVDWSLKDKSSKIYFLDGEELPKDEYEKNWSLLGITHSHNTMFTSPSGTDDTYEVGTIDSPLPTGVHILVGSFSNFDDWKNSEPAYEVYSSISHLGRRYRIESLDSLREFPNETEYCMNSFDEVILDLITTPKAVASKKFIAPKITKKSRKLDLLEEKSDSLRNLLPASPSAEKFLIDEAYGLLDEVALFLHEELGESIQDIVDSVVLASDLEDLSTEQYTNFFEKGDPFYVNSFTAGNFND